MDVCCGISPLLWCKMSVCASKHINRLSWQAHPQRNANILLPGRPINICHCHTKEQWTEWRWCTNPEQLMNGIIKAHPNWQCQALSKLSQQKGCFALCGRRKQVVKMVGVAGPFVWINGSIVSIDKWVQNAPRGVWTGKTKRKLKWWVKHLRGKLSWQAYKSKQSKSNVFLKQA